MLRVALIGAQGTGKTTVWSALREARPDFGSVPELARGQVERMGFRNAYEAVDQYGIGAFELLMLGALAGCDAVEPATPPYDVKVFDRSAIDNYGYFLAHRARASDEMVSGLVERAARTHARSIDQYVYFPCGIFPLTGDDHRSDDPEYQWVVDSAVRRALDVLGIPAHSVHELEATGVASRTQEIIDLIESLCHSAKA